MSFKKLFAALLALSLFVPAQVLYSRDLAAEEAEMENMLFMQIPMIVSASKYEQRVSEAPATVSVITDNEINRYGFESFADILRQILIAFHMMAE